MGVRETASGACPSRADLSLLPAPREVRDLRLRHALTIYEPGGEAPPKNGFASNSFRLLAAARDTDALVFHTDRLNGFTHRRTGEGDALKELGCRPADDVWVVPRLRSGDVTLGPFTHLVCACARV